MRRTILTNLTLAASAISGCSLIADYDMADFPNQTQGGAAGQGGIYPLGGGGAYAGKSSNISAGAGVGQLLTEAGSPGVAGTSGAATAGSTSNAEAGSSAGVAGTRAPVNSGGNPSGGSSTLLAGGGGVAGNATGGVDTNVGVAGTGGTEGRAAGGPGTAGSTGISGASTGAGGLATGGVGTSENAAGMAGAVASAGIAGTSSTCPGTGGPRMVRLPQGFCIDSTEVTRDQYYSWLATNPSAAQQDTTMCAWNASFAPETGCMVNACQGTFCGDHPQVCVDWCDAYAYCKAVGKQLCGKYKFTRQWDQACYTSNGTTYPYGNTYQPKTCNGVDYWVSANPTTLPVAALPECHGAGQLPEVYDMSGNVFEWEDSCTIINASQTTCSIRGGSFGRGESGLKCADTAAMLHNMALSDVGFRCCAT